MNDETREETSKTNKPQRITFLLRMWCEDASGRSNWRASLEMPGTGKRTGFASLEQLFIYLIDFSECRNEVQDQKDKV